ncbi:MAG: hypothetical protein ABII27_03075 [bacterium]
MKKPSQTFLYEKLLIIFVVFIGIVGYGSICTYIKIAGETPLTLNYNASHALAPANVSQLDLVFKERSQHEVWFNELSPNIPWLSEIWVSAEIYFDSKSKNFIQNIKNRTKVRNFISTIEFALQIPLESEYQKQMGTIKKRLIGLDTKLLLNINESLISMYLNNGNKLGKIVNAYMDFAKILGFTQFSNNGAEKIIKTRIEEIGKLLTAKCTSVLNTVAQTNDAPIKKRQLTTSM